MPQSFLRPLFMIFVQFVCMPNMYGGLSSVQIFCEPIANSFAASTDKPFLRKTNESLNGMLSFIQCHLPSVRRSLALTQYLMSFKILYLSLYSWTLCPIVSIYLLAIAISLSVNFASFNYFCRIFFSKYYTSFFNRSQSSMPEISANSPPTPLHQSMAQCQFIFLLLCLTIKQQGAPWSLN